MKKRIVCMLLATMMAFNSVDVSVFAEEMQGEVQELVAESLVISEDIVETEENEVFTTEDVEIENEQGDSELEEELAIEVNSEIEAVVQDSEEESETEGVQTENGMDYILSANDVLEIQVKYVEYDELEGEIYNATELIEMAENMPTVMSESYGNYWDNYSCYFVYNRYNSEMRELWRGLEILCSGYLTNDEDLIAEMTDFVSIEIADVQADIVERFVMHFIYSHPQYYYLSRDIYCSVSNTSVKVAFGVYSAFVNGAVRKNATEKMQTQLDIWLDEIETYATEEEKVKAIHDIICDKVDYNNAIMDIEDGVTITYDEDQEFFTQSAYSVFCTDLAVAAGYTQAFSWLCNAVDISAYGVTSISHAWNKVRVNDNWYNIDVTWDDRDGEGNRIYSYYLRNDSYTESLGQHFVEGWMNAVPECTLDSNSSEKEPGVLPKTEQIATPVIEVETGWHADGATDLDYFYEMLETKKTGYTVSVNTPADEKNYRIYYTLDGETPTEANSRCFIGSKFYIEEGAVIKAIIVADGYQDSEVATYEVYTIESGTAGENIIWQIDSFGNFLIAGTGEMDDYESVEDRPWHEYADYIKNITISNRITRIGNYAFAGLSSERIFNLPGHAISIGDYAFYECSAIVDRYFFIPDTVTTIGNYSFYGCEALTYVEIPRNVLEIGENAFNTVESISGFFGTCAERYANKYGIVFEGVDENEIIDSGICGDSLTWTMSAGGVLTISGTGDMYNYSYNSVNYLAPWYNYDYAIVRLEEGITSIGDNAFCNMKGNGKIHIPEGVTYIGDRAFQDSAFTGELVLPESLTYIGEYAFSKCSGFTGDLVIPPKVEKVGYEAFNECSGFTGDLIISEGVTYIDEWAFWGCYGLTGRLEIASSVKHIGEAAFGGCENLTGELVIPEGITFLGDGAFANCRNMTGEVIIPVGITRIEDQLFYGCSGLTGELIIPEHVTSIGMDAFAGCSGLTGKLTIPEWVTVEHGAFTNCSGFTGELVIPEHWTEIPWGVFMGCTGLTGKLVIPESVTSIGGYAFDGCTGLTGELVIPKNVIVIEEYAFAGCTGLAGELIFPEGITTIGGFAFYACEGFTGGLIIPESVATIGDGAFSRCYGFNGELVLKGSETKIGRLAFEHCYFSGQLIIPEGMTTISKYAFMDCSGFEGVEIPSSVTTIEKYAFMNCWCLEEIEIPSSVTKIEENAFNNCTTAVVFLPPSVTEIGQKAFYLVQMIYGESGSYAERHAKDVDVLFKEYDFENECMACGLCGESLYWKLSLDGELTISGTGQMYDYSEGTAPWYKYRKDINTVILESGVGSIGNYAFYGCKISSGVLSMPETVAYIGVEAIPMVHTIWGVADSYVQDYADKNNITFVDAASIDEWGEYGENFAWVLTEDGTLIVSGIGEMPYYRGWYSCRNAVFSIKIGNGITSISKMAFSGFSKLKGDLIIPPNITYIRDSAFEDCLNLRKVYIPESVIGIGTKAFEGAPVTIYGEVGSYVETYAKENNKKFIPYDFDNKCIATGSCGEKLTWTLGVDGLLSISGTGEMIDYVEGSAPWYAYREYITSLKMEDGVTTIGDYAFYNCDTFKGELIIPETVTEIGDYAFFGCSNLGGDLVIPQKVTVIGKSAFDKCEGLSGTAYISENVTNIGKDALKLMLMIFGTSGSYIELYATENGILFIDAEATTAYGKCGDTLKWVLSDDGVLIISGTGTMYDYTAKKAPWYEYRENIVKLQLEEGITSIGNYAFYYCENIVDELEIPKSVTNIGERAFFHCGGFTGDLIIPEDIISIGESAFAYCGFDGKLMIPEGMTYIESGLFRGCGGFTGELVLPSSVTSIGEYAFERCGSFTGTLALPEGVISIGNWAFDGCSGFTGELVLPSSMTSIGYMAFYDCSNLSGVAYIPSSVTSIGEKAFVHNNYYTEMPILRTIYGEPNSYAETYASENSIKFIEYDFEKGVIGNGKCGESLTWTLGADWTLTITGTGAMYDYTEENVPWYRYRDEILKYELGKDVTTIGAYAFNGCSGLTGDVVIPDGITSIGNSAFNGCSGLSGNAYISSSVTSIGTNALSTITIIYGTVGSSAETYAIDNKITFISVDGINNIVLGTCGENLTWKLDKDTGLFTIFGSGAMYEYDTPTSVPWADYRENIFMVEFSDDLTSISDYAFVDCTKLSGELILPLHLVTIGIQAFSNCAELTGDLVINDSVITIEERAFAGCDKLSGIAYIPSSVTSIGKDAFSSILVIYGKSGSVAEDYANKNNIMFIETDSNEEDDNTEEIYLGKCGVNLKWVFDAEWGELTISGTGSMYDYGNSSTVNITPGWHKHLADIKAVILEEGITSIGDYAFSDIDISFGIVIPDTVTSIGDYAFGEMGKIYVPESVTTIGTNAFSDVSTIYALEESMAESYAKEKGLALVTIKQTSPMGYCGIRCDAVADCDNCGEHDGTNIMWFFNEDGTLIIIGSGWMHYPRGYMNSFSWSSLKNSVTEIDFVGPIVNIGSYAFYEFENEIELTIPTSIRDIGMHAFEYSNVKKIVIQDNEIEISDQAFAGSKLKELVWGSNVTVVGANAFYNCTELSTSFVFNEGLREIGPGAFYNCKKVNGDIILPKSLELLGGYAFAYCSGIDGKIQIQSTTIGLDGTLYDYKQDNYFSKGIFANCYNVKEVIFPDFWKVEKIGDYAFYNCGGLKGEFIFPDTLGSIGEEAFYATEIEHVVFPEGMGAINANAFKDCQKLTGEIIIPSTVTYIGNSPFQGCADLSGYILGENFRYLSDSAFDGFHTIYTIPGTKAWELAEKNGITVVDIRPPFTVTFDSKGGNVIVSQEVKPDTCVVKPENPVRSDYIFDNWYLLNEDGQTTSETPYNFDTLVTANITLVAKWRLKETVVSPISSIPSGTEVYRGTAITLTSETPGALIYYTMDGSTPSVDTGILYRGEIVIDKDVTMKAIAVKDEMWKNSEVVTFVYTVSNTGDVLPEDIPEGGVSAIPEGLWIAGVDAEYTFIGKAIKPTFRVYDHMTLLKEKTDYTVSFKNNTKQNDGTVEKLAPTVTITGKGNYAGKVTKTFAIITKDIADADILATDIVVKYNGKVQKSLPTVTRDGKKLANKTNYTVTYPELYNEDGSENKDAYKVPGTYKVVIKGEGGYHGERIVNLTITEATLMSKVSITKIANQVYTGTAIEPVVTVKNGKTVLAEGTDYTVTYSDNTEVGKATVTVTGIGNYVGTKSITFNITGTSIAKAKVVNLPKTVTYTGNAYTVDDFETRLELTLKIGKETVALIENVDYVISYSKNVEKGTATILFTGIGKYTGNVKKTFKINAYSMKDDTEKMITVAIDSSYVYAKGGVKPEPVVMFGNTILKKGVDYTVSYKNNTAINDGSNEKKLPTVTITGKGNFAGAKTVTYVIEKQEFSLLEMTVADKTYAKKVNTYKSTPVIKDLDGKTLKAGTDYEKAFVYTYKYDTTLDNGEIRYAGDEVLSKDIVPAGTVLVVTVTGKGNYTDIILSAEYRITTAAISKAAVTVPKQTYTGNVITPGTDEMVVKVGNVVLTKDDYEITGYSNNVKKGTATLTIKGKGNYGGTKVVKFTIQAKQFVWYWDMSTMSFRMREV